MRKPAAVLVVSCYLLINLFLSLTNTLLTYFLGFSSLELEQLIMVNIGGIITAIPALLMLKGKDIGRVFYIFWGIFSLGYGIYNANGYPPALIGTVGPIILFVVCIVWLYQSPANEYFRASNRNKVQE